MDSCYLDTKKTTKIPLFIVVYIYNSIFLYGSGITVAGDGTVTASGGGSTELANLLTLLATFATFLIQDVGYYLLYISLFIGAGAVLLAPGDDLTSALEVLVRVVFTGGLLLGGTSFIANYVIASSII